MTMLAWGGLEFGSGMRAAGEAAELRSAVRWGADFLLASAVHLEHNCTFHAQVGRGATQHCDAPGCKFDHGFWGRPEDYPRYRFAHQRRTATIDATRPATEAFAGAAAALASAHLLLRGGGEGGGEGEGGADALYADRLLSVSRRLYACAVGTNPSGARLTTALPEAYPQYQSRSVGDELAWAAVWLADATGEHGRYLGAVRGHLRRGRKRAHVRGLRCELGRRQRRCEAQVHYARLARPRGRRVHVWPGACTTGGDRRRIGPPPPLPYL